MLMDLWSVLTILNSIVRGLWSLRNGIVLLSRVVLWNWSLSLDWKWSSWQMVSSDLESVLSSGVLDTDLLAVRVDIRVLSLSISVGSSLFLELYSIFLDVGRSETSISLEVSSLSQNSSVPWVNISLSGSSGNYGQSDDKESVHC
jgi:hypothetical protein